MRQWSKSPCMQAGLLSYQLSDNGRQAHQSGFRDVLWTGSRTFCLLIFFLPFVSMCFLISLFFLLVFLFIYLFPPFSCFLKYMSTFFNHVVHFSYTHVPLFDAHWTFFKYKMNIFKILVWTFFQINFKTFQIQIKHFWRVWFFYYYGNNFVIVFRNVTNIFLKQLNIFSNVMYIFLWIVRNNFWNLREHSDIAKQNVHAD